MEVRRARPEDLPSALALLGACGLTPSGVADHFHNFWVACDRGRVVATAGLEVYRQVALLRSVATQPAFREPRGAAGRVSGHGPPHGLLAGRIDAFRSSGVPEQGG